MTLSDLLALRLRCDEQRHGKSPAHLLLHEVQSSRGFDARRRCDAISVPLWPSVPDELCGYEFKIARSDWLNELKQPEKGAAFASLVHRFYLVSEKGVARLDEIPESWGWLESDGARLIERKSAPRNDVTPSWELTCCMLARAGNLGARRHAELERLRRDVARLKRELDAMQPVQPSARSGS